MLYFRLEKVVPADVKRQSGDGLDEYFKPWIVDRRGGEAHERNDDRGLGEIWEHVGQKAHKRDFRDAHRCDEACYPGDGSGGDLTPEHYLEAVDGIAGRCESEERQGDCDGNDCRSVAQNLEFHYRPALAQNEYIIVV